MTLDQLALIAQLVSAFGVVASLIFVGFQLLQNTRAVRASTSQAHSANYLHVLASVIENADVAHIWRTGLGDFHALSEDEQVRFLALVSSLFRFYEASRVQWLRGQLDFEHWHTIEQQAKSLGAQPGIRSWWRLRHQWHSPDFRDWFESITPEPAEALYHEQVERPSTHE